MVSLLTSLEKQPHPCPIVLLFQPSWPKLSLFFALINLFEKQQLRKHCMPALKLFTCSMNSLCTDYTHSTGTRPFPLRSPKASKEKHLKLFSLAWYQLRSLRISATPLKKIPTPFFFYIHFSIFISYLITLFISFLINK